MVHGLRVIPVVVGISISFLAASARDALALTASIAIGSGLFLWSTTSWSTSELLVSGALSISLGDTVHVIVGALSIRRVCLSLLLLVVLVVGAVDIVLTLWWLAS